MALCYLPLSVQGIFSRGAHFLSYLAPVVGDSMMILLLLCLSLTVNGSGLNGVDSLFVGSCLARTFSPGYRVEIFARRVPSAYLLHFTLHLPVYVSNLLITRGCLQHF